jgi:hypothetical protein
VPDEMYRHSLPALKLSIERHTQNVPHDATEIWPPTTTTNSSVEEFNEILARCRDTKELADVF